MAEKNYDFMISNYESQLEDVNRKIKNKEKELKNANDDNIERLSHELASLNREKQMASEGLTQVLKELAEEKQQAELEEHANMINKITGAGVIKSDKTAGSELKEIQTSRISENPKNPRRKILDNEKMAELCHSILENGLTNPIKVVKRGDRNYEVISGHRRLYAHKKLNIPLIKALVLPENLTEEDIDILMVDENNQEELKLSEQAKSYKLKLNAMKRQGQRSDLTCTENQHKLKSVEILADEIGISRDKLQRLVKIADLTDDLLDLLDDGKIKQGTAYEIAFFNKESQENLFKVMNLKGKLNPKVANMFDSNLRKVLMPIEKEQGSLSEDVIYATYENYEDKKDISSDKEKHRKSYSLIKKTFLKDEKIKISDIETYNNLTDDEFYIVMKCLLDEGLERELKKMKAHKETIASRNR